MFVKMAQGISTRLVRIIRQGSVSILRAVRMVLFPPPGANPAEIWHEASKLRAAGIVVSGGVVLEERVTKALPVSI